MGNNLFTIISDEDKQQLLESGALFTGEGEAVRLEAPADRLLTIMKLLRDQGCACNYLGDITAADRGEAGFELIYQLYSLSRQAKGTVKTSVGRDNPVVPSVTALWPGGDWLEREVYDLMGIRFENHPDLSRILLDENFVGHPLRKDFRMQPAD